MPSGVLAAPERRTSSAATNAIKAAPTTTPITMPAMAPPLRPLLLLEEDCVLADCVARSAILVPGWLAGTEPAAAGAGASLPGNTVLARPEEMEEGDTAVLKSSKEMEEVMRSSTWAASCRPGTKTQPVRLASDAERENVCTCLHACKFKGRAVVCLSALMLQG